MFRISRKSFDTFSSSLRSLEPFCSSLRFCHKMTPEIRFQALWTSWSRRANLTYRDRPRKTRTFLTKISASKVDIYVRFLWVFVLLGVCGEKTNIFRWKVWGASAHFRGWLWQIVCAPFIGFQSTFWRDATRPVFRCWSRYFGWKDIHRSYTVLELPFIWDDLNQEGTRALCVVMELLQSLILSLYYEVFGQ